jgi:hypothetical protein
MLWAGRRRNSRDGLPASCQRVIAGREMRAAIDLLTST